MPVTLEEFGIDRLNVRDRLELIDLIWDSLSEQVEPDELSPMQLAEIAQRRAEMERNPGVGKPWREALAKYGE